MNLSQTLEVFLVNRGESAAMEVARKRSGRWFDPELVRAAASLAKRGKLWEGLEQEHADHDASLGYALGHAQALEPEDRRMLANEETIEKICQAFAEIIDAKSPFTFRHSNGVADAAVAISRQLSLREEDVTFMRRAALVHDIGKLGVSNSILEKPAALDVGEWEVIKKHPYYSREILRRIPGFEDLSEVAGAHHEKLDGSGYFSHLGADRLSLEMRILTVADIFDALAAKRPYRDALPLEKVFGIMRKDAPRAIDAQCLDALMMHHLGRPGTQPDAQPSTQDLLGLAANIGTNSLTSSLSSGHRSAAILSEEQREEVPVR
jgi:putative nucleotidyltransferase with HDIG domain